MLKADLIDTLFISENNVLISELNDIVTWKKPPSFKKMGRTAWFTLSKPIYIPSLRLNIKSIKIKGVGLFDHLNNILPPSTNTYNRIHPHLGFTKNGEFIHILSDPCPLGGITFEKAQNEFNISYSLISNGCMSQIPLLLYKYQDLFFGIPNKPISNLGVVLSGFTEETYIRFDNTVE